MGVDYNNFPTGGALVNHNNKVFDDLSACALKAVDRAVSKRTHTMHRTLKNRAFMGNQGRFPKSEGKTRNGEAHSHTQWQIRQKGSGYWILFNNHRNSVDGYPYVRNLLYGTGWSTKAGTGIPNNTQGGAARLVRKGSKVFSTQMPNGITPWMRAQKKHMIKDIEIAIAVCNAKGQ